ncbi:hypothetical protein BSKO_08539 [Bryopsis sp. KO-2023]|nr:hypothetical protein BSKO_08539 [Bryopsis sp. KO-2023]
MGSTPPKNSRPSKLVTAPPKNSVPHNLSRQHTRPTDRQIAVGLHQRAGGRRLIVRAGPDESASEKNSWLEFARGLTSTPLYRVYLQGGVVLGVLGLVDAAYSGDWSRIGAISKADEAFLQQIVWIVFGVHVASSLGAAKLKSDRGQDWLIPAGKALAVGFLAFIEVVFDDEPPRSSP